MKNYSNDSYSDKELNSMINKCLIIYIIKNNKLVFDDDKEETPLKKKNINKYS